MNSKQFKKWLAGLGATFVPGKGGALAWQAERAAHDGSKDIGKGLEHSIMKDLGLK